MDGFSLDDFLKQIKTNPNVEKKSFPVKDNSKITNSSNNVSNPKPKFSSQASLAKNESQNSASAIQNKNYDSIMIIEDENENESNEHSQKSLSSLVI